MRSFACLCDLRGSKPNSIQPQWTQRSAKEKHFPIPSAKICAIVLRASTRMHVSDGTACCPSYQPAAPARENQECLVELTPPSLARRVSVRMHAPGWHWHLASGLHANPTRLRGRATNQRSPALLPRSRFGLVHECTSRHGTACCPSYQPAAPARENQECLVELTPPSLARRVSVRMHAPGWHWHLASGLHASPTHQQGRATNQRSPALLPRSRIGLVRVSVVMVYST